MIKYTFLFALAIASVVFALNNSVSISINLYPMPYEVNMPLFVAIFTSFLSAVIMSSIINASGKIKLSYTIKKQKQRINALENEITILKIKENINETLPATNLIHATSSSKQG